MKYRVLKYFTDLQDNNHAYHVGEQFPHAGLEVSNERLEELSTAKNKRGIPLIELVEEEAEKAPIQPQEKQRAKGKGKNKNAE